MHDFMYFRPSNARGWPVGETHPRARHSDATVGKAHAMRALGFQHKTIAATLRVSRHTVNAWLAGKRRTAKVERLIAVRVVTPSAPAVPR